MCLVIALVLFGLSYGFFIQENLLGGWGSLVGALFFILLMIKNILDTKKRKEKK